MTLVEAPRVPTLTEPFTPEQQLAIRAANWMSTQREFDWEVSLRANQLGEEASPFWKEFCGERETALRYILSPVERSALLELSVTDRENRLVWGQVLSVSRESSWLLAPHRQAKLEWGDFHGTLLLQMVFDVQPPNSQGYMSSINFGGGWNSKVAKEGLPVREEISIAPLAMILNVVKETNKVELTDERMTIRGEMFEMIIDAQTGRLITWNFDYEGNRIEIRMDQQVYAAAANKWQTQRAASQDRLDAGAPVTTMLQYVTEEARSIEKLQTQRAAVRVGNRLCFAPTLH